jgi:hypothetical protein
LTIPKSITLSSYCFYAGVLVSVTNGIVVSAASTDVVILRGLDIEGLGTGLAGIKVLSAGAVHVENCTISHFTQNGIEFVPTSASASTSQLHVSNTILRTNTGTGGAIHVKPGANVTVNGTIENTQMRNNSVGLRVEDNSTMEAKNTTVANSAGSGFIAASNGAAVSLNLNSCLATGNLNGITSHLGANATVRISSFLVAGHPNGLVTAAGAKLFSFGNNFVSDPNTAAPTLPNIAQQ